MKRTLPPLSRKLTEIGIAANDVAAQRQTDSASLRRLVSGDLGRITMKAAAKARSQRYTSVSALAADIRRYLEHRPVLATPPDALYRVRKFFRRHRIAVLTTAAGFAFVVLAGMAVWSFARGASPSKAKLTDKDTIVLADFENKTGDVMFDDTLRQGLTVELRQSPFLNLISDTRIRQTLALMGQPKDTRLTSEIAQQVCERTASAAILEGSIANLGKPGNCWSEVVQGNPHRNTRFTHDCFKPHRHSRSRCRGRSPAPGWVF